MDFLLAVLEWIDTHNGIVTAFATLGLATFGGIQIWAEGRRRKDALNAARFHLAGPARLTRKSLDAMFVAAAGKLSAIEWVGSAHSYMEQAETGTLETLRLASQVGGKEAECANTAFESFLAFGENMKRIGTVPATVTDGQGHVVDYSPDERALLNTFARAALISLKQAADALAEVAPRREHEQPPPREDEITLLVGSPSVRPLPTE
jgi:hypothetical protein